MLKIEIGEKLKLLQQILILNVKLKENFFIVFVPISLWKRLKPITLCWKMHLAVSRQHYLYSPLWFLEMEISIGSSSKTCFKLRKELRVKKMMFQTIFFDTSSDILISIVFTYKMNRSSFVRNNFFY